MLGFGDAPWSSKKMSATLQGADGGNFIRLILFTSRDNSIRLQERELVV